MVAMPSAPSPRPDSPLRGPIDAASLIAVPASAFGHGEQAARAANHVIDDLLRGQPELIHVLHSEHGDVGLYLIPVTDRDLFRAKERALDAACKGVQLAATHGARTISLTGMIPAGTEYGHALQRALDERPAPPSGWPRLTTGHAAVVAAFLLNIERLLDMTGRRLAEERAAFVGLGSIGTGLLELMMSQDERPASVVLVDVESKRERIEQTRNLMRERFAYNGPIDIELVTGEGHLPEHVYPDASLLLTMTSSEEVIDVDKLRPGAIMVDDSFPLGFSAERAVERIKRDKDILITIAGAFSTPGSALHWSEEERLRESLVVGMRERIEQSARVDEWSLTGCIYASLLTEPLGLPFTLGPVTAADSMRFYEVFKQRGFCGTPPYVITPRSEQGAHFIGDDVIEHMRRLSA
jgi:predicted amino acid dehydrogenase